MEKDTYLQIMIKDSLGEITKRVEGTTKTAKNRKTIRVKVTSYTKIVINSTMTKNKKVQWRLSPRANSYNTRAFGDIK